MRYLPHLPGKICNILNLLRASFYHGLMTLGDVGEKNFGTGCNAKESELHIYGYLRNLADFLSFSQT